MELSCTATRDINVTAIWNRRTDKCGGDLENRLRFEALQAIKNGVGRDFPVTCRFGHKHFMKASSSGTVEREGYTEAARDVPEGIEMA